MIKGGDLLLLCPDAISGTRCARRPNRWGVKTIGIILGLHCLGCGSVGNGSYGPALGTLAFSVQPSPTLAGDAITPAVRVVVQDAQGNTVTGASTTIAVSIGTNHAGGTLSGTATVAAVNGVATFSNLSLNKSGEGYTLIANATDLTGTTSNPFNVTPALPTQLAFAVQPSLVRPGNPIRPAVEVALRDALGNTVTSASTSITVAIGANPAGGMLSGTTTVAAVNGVATFSNLSIDRIGRGYNLTASSAGLRGATSALFNIARVSFNDAVEYPAYEGPWSVAVGDFNRDGKWDLALANPGNWSVTVWLGKGDGTFQWGGRFDAGASPWSVVVGDFNGDGAPDLAVANSGAPALNGVSILLGNGDGTFQAPRHFSTGDYSVSVAAGDFNRDGRLDVAVANHISGTVSVLLGNGDGTFQVARDFAVDVSANSVAVADFNGDGKLDIACASESGTVSILLGNGDGTFQPASSFRGGGAFASLALGDFNGDSVLDLAVSSLYGVWVLLGNGDGTFQAARNFSAGLQPWSVVVGDFDKDGVADLAVANLGYCDPEPCDLGSSISVLLGNGDGTFEAPVNFYGGGGPRSLATADFNGDGLPDLAVAHTIPTGLAVLLNNTPDQ